MSNLPARTSALSPQKRRLLMRRAAELKATRIRPADEQRAAGALPLSYGQSRLWFLHQTQPDSPAYNLLSAWRLRGPLDIAALERAVAVVVERHEVLRSAVNVSVNGPVQQPIAIQGRLRHVDAAGKDYDALAELCVRLAETPFDLTAGQVFRADLIRVTKDDHLLLLCTHHIAGDGWSDALVQREISQAYTGTELKEVPIQYADFAVWQREWLDGDRMAEQARYWRDTLRGIDEVLDFPTDRPRPADPDPGGGTVEFHAPRPALTAARTLCEAEGTTLFGTFLALYQAFLHRHTGQTDFAVGVPVTNRPRPELADVVGFFVNTLPIAARCGGDPTVRELLGRVRRETINALFHQDIPFERIVREVAPRRDSARSPLFQTMFVWQEDAEPELSLPGVEVTRFAVPWRTSKFETTLWLTADGDDLRGSLEYRRELFDTATAQRIAERWVKFIEAALAAPDTPISALPLLVDAEHAWFDEVNAASFTAPAPDLAELLSLDHGDTVALRGTDDSLSYADLDAEVEALAGRLRAAGLGPDRLVGVLLPPGFRLITAVLAVLRVGAAYVPLDLGLAPARLAYMLDDSQARHLITDRANAERVPAGSLDVLLIDDDTGRTAPLDVRPAPGHLAYVMYTSGSTGRPKGVMVSRGALANYLAWAAGEYGVRPGDTVPLQSSFSFDMSVTSVYTPLVAGATLEITGSSAGAADLAGSVASGTPYGLFKLSPAALRVLEQELPQEGSPRTARCIVLGGEQLHGGHVRRWLAADPDLAVYNEYGPTEATVGCAVYRLPREVPNGPVPIGRPFANARIWLLDSRFQPVPVGVVGDLYVGGPGLARGYHRRPGLTAERFVPDPFGPPGERLYRTGDKARWSNDGELHYLGRDDGQVKIRGFRVELGEIEETLIRHPSVERAAVSVHSERLIAYVVLAAPVPADELLRFAGSELPPYMVPAKVLPVDSIPLTPNGKVDHAALPTPTSGRPDLQTDYAEPVGPVERTLAELLAEVVDVAEPGRNDGFFELGGDSIRAAVLAARARAAGCPLTISDILQHGTVAAMATAVSFRTDSATESLGEERR